MQSSIPFRTISHEESRTRDPLRELVLLTSYNKTDKLDVPVFTPELKQRRLPLKERVVRGLSLHNNWVSNIARSLALPARALALAVGVDVRYEPMSETAVHRSYPSPRGLFPVDIYLVFSRPGQEIRLAYDMTHHALLHDPKLDLGESRAGWTVRIQLACALDRIAPLYGNLSISLCALELGHLAHQICAAHHSLGVSFECRMLAAPGSEGCISGTEHSLPLVDILLEGQDYLAPSNSDFVDMLRISSHTLNESDWNDVARERAWIAGTASVSRAIQCAGRDCDFPFKQSAKSCHRGAGNIETGTFAKAATSGELDALVASILADYRASSSGQARHPVLTILRTHADFSVTAIHGDETSAQETVANGCVPLSEAYGTFYNIDLQTIRLVAVFTADFGTLMREESSWSYLEMLVLAGIYAQRMCNEAAAQGFNARPFKGMREHIIETAFNLRGQCFYTVLLGKSADRNPALSLNSLRSRA